MDSSLLETFSSRLRETRGDMMQATFAQKIGVSRASLSSYENGTRIPDIETLKHIYEETGVSLYYLLGLTNSKDDAFATAQRDTGLSEKALLHFAQNPISAKVVNHLVACGAMKSFSDRAAILHDESLICHQYQQCGWSDTSKALRDKVFFDTEKQLHALLSAILIDEAFRSEPFGADEKNLPSISVSRLIDGVKKTYHYLDTLTRTEPSTASIPLVSEAVREYEHLVKQFTRTEEQNGQETPEQ